MSPQKVRLLFATTIAALLVACTTAGVLAWILVDPQHWFADAYAQKGDRGDPGPRGPVGPPGPPDLLDPMQVTP